LGVRETVFENRLDFGDPAVKPGRGFGVFEEIGLVGGVPATVVLGQSGRGRGLLLAEIHQFPLQLLAGFRTQSVLR
jgi:hypothetical protein